MAEKLEFKTTIEDVIRLFGPEGIIYSQDHSVFLRELVQNALDSIEIHRAKENVEGFRGRIEIAYAPGRIMVQDNGWGLDRDGFEEHFTRPLRGIRRYLAAGARELDTIIGHFGVGFLSVFKASDYVEMQTRRRGCPGLSVNMGLKRGFARGEQSLDLESFITETPCDFEHGMRVTVFLGSADSDTARRAELVDSVHAVRNALEFYVRHTPPDVDIVFRDTAGIVKKFDNQPFNGEGSDITHRIRYDGFEGCIAFSFNTDKPVFRVCQRGLLVRENYPNLLPETAGAVVGEINLLRTDIVDLSLSRESFLENEKFNKLRSMLESELKEFDKLFKEILEKKMAAREDWSQPKKQAVREDSQHADTLLEMYHRGIQKNVYFHKICEEVAFYLESEGVWLTLDDIIARARAQNKLNIYVYEKDTKYLFQFTTFDQLDYYTHKEYVAAEVAYLKSRGELVVRLTKREDGERFSFMEIVTQHIGRAGLGVEGVEAGRVIPAGDDVHLNVPGLDLRVIHIPDAQDKQAFTTRYGPASKPIVQLNSANPRVQDLLSQVKEAPPESGNLEKLIRAYCLLLGAQFNDVANIIHEMLVRESEENINHELVDGLIGELKAKTEAEKIEQVDAVKAPEQKKEPEYETFPQWLVKSVKRFFGYRG